MGLTAPFGCLALRRWPVTSRIRAAGLRRRKLCTWAAQAVHLGGSSGAGDVARRVLGLRATGNSKPGPTVERQPLEPSGIQRSTTLLTRHFSATWSQNLTTDYAISGTTEIFAALLAGSVFSTGWHRPLIVSAVTASVDTSSCTPFLRDEELTCKRRT